MGQVHLKSSPPNHFPNSPIKAQWRKRVAPSQPGSMAETGLSQCWMRSHASLSSGALVGCPVGTLYIARQGDQVAGQLLPTARIRGRFFAFRRRRSDECGACDDPVGPAGCVVEVIGPGGAVGVEQGVRNSCGRLRHSWLAPSCGGPGLRTVVAIGRHRAGRRGLTAGAVDGDHAPGRVQAASRRTRPLFNFRISASTSALA